MADKAVITGGAGFIGSHLADRLLSLGQEVVILDNLSSGFIENIPPSARLVRGDATDPTVVAQAVEGASTVYHLAAVASVQAGIDNPLHSHAACGTSALVVGVIMGLGNGSFSFKPSFSIFIWTSTKFLKSSARYNESN